ncbi:MAG: hypothetical protein FJX47_06435, partial [Alphaproteobacteria bacterium]|nr:hypothetical protein [Alphaproteobacteria bacterium]
MAKRLLLVVVLSLVIAALLTMVLAAIYSQSRAMHELMSPRAFSLVAIAAFILTLLLSGFILSMSMTTREDWSALFATESGGNAAPGPARPGQKPARPVAEKETPGVTLATATAAQANPGAVPTAAAASATGTPIREEAPDLTRTRPHEVPVAAPKALGPADAAKSESAVLVEKSLAGLKAFGLTIDDKTRLGAALFLAGAAEALAEKHRLPSRQALSTVESGIDLLGGEATFAEDFGKIYVELVKKPENAAVFGAGRKAVLEPPPPPSPDEASQGEAAPAVSFALALALDEWLGDSDKPTLAEGSEETILIAETDGIAPTDPPKPKDLARIEGCRRILRRAMRIHGGIALKTNINGMVASFPRPGDALSASAEMMQGAAESAKFSPDGAVQFRIGIASARPAARDKTLPPAEDLAQRFARHAKPGEIIADRPSCLGAGELGRGARDRGTLALGGVARPITLMIIDWKTVAANAPSPTQTETQAAPAANSAAASAAAVALAGTTTGQA